MSKAKRNALLLLATTGILTLILGTSLSTLTLSNGEPFSLGETDVTMPGTSDAVPGNESLLWVLRGFIALAFIALPIYIMVSLFSAQGRRRLLVNLLIVLLLFVLLDFLDDRPAEEDSPTQEAMSAGDIGDLIESSSPPVFSADEAPPWLATVTILIASLLSVGLLVTGVWFFRRRAGQDASPLDSLAETAQDTIESLRSGGDFRTAIIQCYYEMNRVIKQERGISRQTAMTPHEFETYLTDQGLPQRALATLTHLFEQARYGNMPSQTDDEAIAVDCLTEIVNTCKGLRFGHEKQ